MDWEAMWTRDGGLQPGQAFDAAQCEPAFAALLKSGEVSAASFDGADPPTALVPGCGRGYAVLELAKAGFQATGLDIAPTAIAAATELRDSVGIADEQAHFAADDFFSLGGSYNLIYDCTFLCAIPIQLREQWANQMAKLLAEGGELVTLVFPLGDYEGGPPFAMSEGLLRSLLEPRGFECVHHSVVPENMWARGSRSGEQLMRWRRPS